jgi:hypothetical protein
MRGPKPHRLLQAIPAIKHQLKKRESVEKSGRKDSNLHTAASEATGLPLADTRMNCEVRSKKLLRSFKLHPSHIKLLKSAMSESNRPHWIGSPAPLPLGQWHIDQTHISQDGWIRTNDLVFPEHTDSQTFLHPEISGGRWTRTIDLQGMNLASLPTALPRKSVQRESNPHYRHGKAAGFRYIMDAF